MQLSRYIPELRTAGSATEKMAIIQRVAAAGFEQAQARAQTYPGVLQQLSNTFGDFQEKVGDSIIKNNEFKEAIGKVKGYSRTQDLLNPSGLLVEAWQAYSLLHYL